MGCSDNWARDRVDREEVEQRRKQPNYLENDLGLKQRCDRYVRQFCKVVHILTDEQLIELLHNDREFAITFVEHQRIDKEAGRDWIEVIAHVPVNHEHLATIQIIRHSTSK